MLVAAIYNGIKKVRSFKCMLKAGDSNPVLNTSSVMWIGVLTRPFESKIHPSLKMLPTGLLPQGCLDFLSLLRALIVAKVTCACSESKCK